MSWISLSTRSTTRFITSTSPIFPLRAIEALVKDSAFMLSRVDHYPIHGGSILFHLRHRSSKAPPHASVAQALEKEKQMRLAEPVTWEAFAQRVSHIRAELPALLRKLKAQGKRIIGYGASAKGNTLLNTCGITHEGTGLHH